MNYKIGTKLRFKFGRNSTRIGTVKKKNGSIFMKYTVTVDYTTMERGQYDVKGDNIFYYVISEKDVIEQVDCDYKGWN